MTGYGAASIAIPGGRLAIELRTVNQRFLDVRLTAPREYGCWESEARETVRRHVERGRVEVLIHRSAPARASRVVLDVEAARAHAAAWRKLKRVLGVPGPIDLALFRTPEIFHSVDVPLDVRRELPAVARGLDLALGRLDRAREREGRNLARDMRQRIDRLQQIAGAMRARTTGLAGEIQARLTERMEKLLAGAAVDPARIAQEAAYVAERGDVTEELVRLASHLSALGPLLRAEAAVGKQIEFLLQEVHREINTIGSKVGDLDVTRLVVEAKGEVERLREQVQNVE